MPNQGPGPAAGPFGPTAGAATTEQWEYKIVVLKAEKMEGPSYVDPLNQLGAEGWELVNVSPGNAVIKYFCYFFKRRKRP